MKRVGVIMDLPKPVAFGGVSFGANALVSIPGMSTLASRGKITTGGV